MTNDELDRAVALEVMGMTPSCPHNLGDPACEGYGCIWLVGGVETEELLYIRAGYVESGYVFSPSSDWRSAGAVVEKLVGAGCVLSFYPGKVGVDWSVDGRSWEERNGYADDGVPRALSLAALATARAGALEGKP